MTRLLSLFIPLCTLAAPVFSEDGCHVAERTLDGRRQVVIENRFLKLVIEPRKGGRVVQFLLKTGGVELVRPKLGMLWDRFWQAPRRQDPWAGEYSVKFLQQDAERVVLRLSREATGNWNFHGIDKTVTITADSPRILVDYAYRVHENRMTPSIISPWVVNGMSPAGEENKLFMPLTDGIRVTAYTPTAPPMHQKFHYNPARGWMAAAGQKSSAGVAATMELSRVMAFYMWFGNNLNTMEWMYNTSEIRHGDTLKLRHEIIPFRGLKTVAGAGGGVVVQLDVPDKTAPGVEAGVRIKVYDSLAGPVDVTVKCEKLPGRLSKINQRRALNIAVDETRSFSFPWRPTDSGTYAVHGEVFRAGAKICDFELPVRVGETKENYTLQPLVKRIGNPDERFGAKGAALSQKDIPELEFKDDVVTPHIKWGKPYYRGPLRVFMLTDQMQGRDIIELKQRLQIECITPLAIVNKRLFTGDLYGKYTTEMAVFDLTTRLKKKDFDVIVIGGGCQIWTAKQRKMVADLVRGGVGLVWTSAPTPEELKDVLPLDAPNTIRYRCAWQPPIVKNHPVTLQLPLELLPRTKVQTSKLAEGATVLAEAADGHRRLPLVAVKEAPGHGRVVQMAFGSSWQSPGAAYGGIVPFDEMDAREPYPYWEYWYSMVARAILWAGRHEAPAQPIVSKLDCKPVPGQLAGCTLEVGLTAAVADLPEPQVELVLRDSYATEIARATRPWKGESLSFELGPVVGTGRYFVDLRFTAQGKAVSWGTYGFVAKGGSGLRAVKLNRDKDTDVFNDGEEIAVIAEVTNPAPGVQIVGQLYDGFERLLSTTAVAAQAQTQLSLPAVRPLHPGGILVTRLVKDNKTLSINKRYVTLMPAKWAAQEWDDFTGIVWGVLGAYQRSWLGRAKADIMRGLGYNAHNAIARWAPIDSVWPTRLGFRLVSMNTLKTSHDPKNDEATRAKYRESGNKLDLVRKPSLSDPEFLRATREKADKAVRSMSPFKPLAYNFGDEVAYAPNGLDYDFSPHALAEMREWLKTQYPSLDALNKEWEAEFKTWAEVMPDTAREAVASGRYARWADLRLFACTSVAKFHRELIAEMKKTDPKARYGLSGTQVPYPYNAMDWAQLGSVFSYHSNYWGGGELPHLHIDATPGCRFAQWNGYSSKGDLARHRTWQRFLCGQAGVSFYEQFSMLNPDLRPSQSGRDIADATRDMRTGLTKLLLKGRLEKDRIAIYYSMPSILGSSITGHGAHKHHRYGWLWAVKDCGIMPRYITYLDVRKSGISRKDFDVLILPRTMAMSPEEVEAVKAFVRDGGTVLTDALPAVLSGHCRKLRNGALDEVFGVRHENASKPDGPAGQLTVTGTAEGLSVDTWEQGTQLSTRRVKLAGGQALGKMGDTPALIVHRFGQGKACYLNLSMAKYLDYRAEGNEAAMRERIRRILTWAGARQTIQAVTPNGTPIDKLEIFRHVVGPTTIAGFVLDADVSREAKITFPKAGHVYDVRKGTYLGNGQTFQVSLPHRDALLLAHVPYEVKSVTIRTNAADAGEQATVSFRIEASGKTSSHCLRLEVISPKGEPIAHLAQNVLAENGTATTTIPFALNDPPGDYTISARDVTSGVTSETRLQLRPHSQ